MGRESRPRRSGPWRRVQAVLAVLALAAVVWATLLAPAAGPPGAATSDQPLLGGDVASVIENARALAADGRLDEAAALLEPEIAARAAAGDDLTVREFALLQWERAVLALLTEDDATEDLVQDAYRGLAGARCPLRRGEVTAQTYGFDGASRLVVERLPPGLDEPAAPQHALAAAHVATLLGCGVGTADALVDHLLLRGPAAAPALPAVLRALAECRNLVRGLHDRSIRRLLEGLPHAAVVDALSRVARDPEQDALSRRCCERWLGEVEDVPIGLSTNGTPDELLREAFPEGEILAAADRLRAMPAADAFRERLRMANDERAVAGTIGEPRGLRDAAFRSSAARSDRSALESWIERHTGLSAQDVRRGALDEWVRDDSEVVVLLREACGLPGEGRIPAERELQRMERERNVRPLLHQLLTFLAPSDVEPPTWLAGSSDAPDIVTRWCRALRIAPQVTPLRIAHWELRDGRWRITEHGRQRVEVVEGADTRDVGIVEPLGPQAGAQVRARVPGMGWGDDTGPRYQETLHLRTWRGRYGPMMSSSVNQAMVTPSSRKAVRTGGSNGWTMPFTVGATAGVGSMSTPDVFRNHLTLVRPEPPGVEVPGLPDGPWDEAAWRTAIASDLGRLADLAEQAEPWWEFHNAHQTTLWNLSAVCMAVRVPEALPALRRLLAEAPRWQFALSRDMLLLAALNCGADDLVDDPNVRVLAAGVALDGMTKATIGPGPKSWVRLWLQTDDPALRSLAESAIAAQGLSSELAADVRAAVAAGTTDVTPGMQAALSAVPVSTAPTLREALSDEATNVGLLALLDLLLLALPAAVLVASFRRVALPRTAAIAVALGVASTAFSVGIFGVELIPAGLGAVAAAIGAWHAAGIVSSRWGRCAALAFGVAAGAAFLLRPLEGPAMFVGVLATAALGRDALAAVPAPDSQAPRRAGAGISRRLLVLAVLLAALGAAGLAAALRGLPSRPLLVIVAVALCGALLLGSVLPSMVRVDPAAPRARWPAAFLLLYALPVGGVHVVSLFALVYPVANVTLPGTWGKVVQVLGAASVLWCLGRLLDGARELAHVGAR